MISTRVVRFASVFLVLCFTVGCASQKGAMDMKDSGMTPANDASGDIAAVEAVVNGLFDAMRERDGDKVESLFMEGTMLNSTATSTSGEPMITKMPAANFADAVRQATGDMWDEKIWDLKIEVNNRLASAWMDYAFYRGETFSHCGSNSFQLFKGDDGWKIIYLADSRQRQGCEIPESVKPGVNG